ncbi:MAG: formylglycine-generating enzyme family protein [Myxococcales bacterium]|jgi:sulfatase modifying factor 1|nr:formylglycine-generating enzyme family protein [Myxococcales bacterium]
MRNRPRLLDGIPEPWAVEWGEDRHGLFMSFAVDDCVQKLRYIRPGRFLMGSPESEFERFPDEGPQHKVELTQGYWLADTPCTQALWQAVMGNNPSHFRGSDRPVEQVSWDDCQEFLWRLNERVPGLQARLPSEAEWECACRARMSGRTNKEEIDLNEDGSTPILEPIAWYRKNSGKQSQPVRRKEANTWGLYDLLGNVWEWCQDYYGAYKAESCIDPTGAPMGSRRILRGGSWNSPSRSMRVAVRNGYSPGDRRNNLGFRLARDQGDG